MTATNCKTEPHPLRRFKEAVTGGGRMKSVLRVAMLALRETMMPSLSDQRRAAVAMVLAACLIGGSAMSHVRAAETPPVPNYGAADFKPTPQTTTICRGSDGPAGRWRRRCIPPKLSISPPNMSMAKLPGGGVRYIGVCASERT